MEEKKKILQECNRYIIFFLNIDEMTSISIGKTSIHRSYVSMLEHPFLMLTKRSQERRKLFLQTPDIRHYRTTVE